jgi:ParB/RepB/Spo0J family partition protein
MPENSAINLDITEILPPYLMLRVVDRRSLDYMELRDSIAAHGILNSITVRKSAQIANKYEVIDGMYRLACAKDVGITIIPCVIVSASDEEALLMQIEANMQRPPTKRAEFALHLKRLFAADPDLTFEALSVRINKNPAWIRATLKLVRLCDAAKRELDAGNLPLVAAYAMCRLPQTLQAEFLPKALCMSGKDAAVICNGMMKEYIERIVKQHAEKFFIFNPTPTPYLRNLRMIKSEFEKPLSGTVILSATENDGDLTPLNVWRLALAWVLHLDSDSVKQYTEKQRIKFDKMEQQILERREKRATLKRQKDLGLTDDWRNSLIED